MNKNLKHQYLPALTLICGGAGMLLRIWLMSTENSSGFITRGHISELLLLLLTGIFLGALFLATRSLRQGNKYRFNFPASPIAAGGTMLAAFGIGIASVTDLLSGPDAVTAVTSLVGLAAAAGMLLASQCRWEGARPAIILHGAVCLWLILRLLSLYRAWSSDPQLADYGFQLMAVVFCMLAAYHRAAFNGGEGSRPQYAFFALAGVYFCCLSLTGPDSILLYLSLGAWLCTDLCSLKPMPRDARSEQ